MPSNFCMTPDEAHGICRLSFLSSALTAATVPIKPKSPIVLRLEALASDPYPVKVRLKIRFKYMLDQSPPSGPYYHDAIHYTTFNIFLSRYADHCLSPSGYKLKHFDFIRVDFRIDHGLPLDSEWYADGMKPNYKRNMDEIERMQEDFLNELVETAEGKKARLQTGAKEEAAVLGEVTISYVRAGERGDGCLVL